VPYEGEGRRIKDAAMNLVLVILQIAVLIALLVARGRE
jgi:hypothetical protein